MLWAAAILRIFVCKIKYNYRRKIIMEEKVLDILESVCGTDEVREDKDINLFEAGLLDSLGVTELLIEIEEKLGIEIAPTEVTRGEIETPNKIIQYISKKGM
jgi:D-alanine--poly(phosphoribitol) ligase subunit 2